MARRRGNNEGSIYQRSNGTWRAQVRVQGRRLSTTVKTRHECQDWLKKTVSQIDGGLTCKGAKITLEEYLGNWLGDIQATIRTGTHNQYEMCCRDYIIPALGNIRLSALTPGHLQELYNQKIKEGKGVRTIKIIHVVLHKSLRRAVKLGLIGRNPADIAEPPKYQPKEMKFFTATPVSQMLLAAREDCNEALYIFAVTTGMRQSELLALKWSDLDWQKRILHIQRQLTVNNRKDGYYVPLKTKASNRTIDIGQKTVESLREHYERQ